jgi:hypothetical protein
MPLTTRKTLAAMATACSLMACAEASTPTRSLEPGEALAAKGPKGPKGGGNESGDDDGGAGVGQGKMTICHVGEDGLYVMLTVGAPGAANHLDKHAGDVAATMRNGSYGCATRPSA